MISQTGLTQSREIQERGAEGRMWGEIEGGERLGAGRAG